MPDLSPTLLGVAASLALFALPSPAPADRLADPLGPAQLAELRPPGPAALAVPPAPIDSAAGRWLVRTTTGTGAHSVLDEDGHVLDVLPGLYAPAVFQRELANSLALAEQVRGMPAQQRIAATVAYHAAALDAT